MHLSIHRRDPEATKSDPQQKNLDTQKFLSFLTLRKQWNRQYTIYHFCSLHANIQNVYNQRPKVTNITKMTIGKKIKLPKL